MEIEIKKEKKKKISAFFWIVGIGGLIIGISPWGFDFKTGLLILIYSLVFMYAIKIAVIDAEMNNFPANDDSHDHKPEEKK